MPILCPTCGTLAPDDARFCERDGTRLTEADAEPLPTATGAAMVPVAAPTAAAVACRCGAGPEARVDGYCDTCGRKWVPPRTLLPRDHHELVLSLSCAGVTDRGQRHHRNEDDFAVSLTNRGEGVLLVCDGVSSSEDADRASAIAAKTLRERLTDLSAEADMDTALRQAVAAANHAVGALSSTTPGATSAPPETTMVAAVVRERTAFLAWVGDSRAYWIDRQNSTASLLLTHDHSWWNEMVDSGQMTPEDAGMNRLAHAITRCLGTAADDADSSEPSLATFPFPDTGGFLLLCSDGLWNYAPTPLQITELVTAAIAAPPTEGVVAIARTLVAWANAQGGRDNITVAVWEVPANDLPTFPKEKP